MIYYVPEEKAFHMLILKYTKLKFDWEFIHVKYQRDPIQTLI